MSTSRSSAPAGMTTWAPSGPVTVPPAGPTLDEELPPHAPSTPSSTTVASNGLAFCAILAPQGLNAG